jgi:hypothetical protein
MTFIGAISDRGGAGRNGDGTWPATDGKGCPNCGAVGKGGHGGHCQNGQYTYDESGRLLGRKERVRRV